MNKNLIIGKKSARNEIELHNHKKKLFLNKKRKSDSEDSSPMNSKFQMLSYNPKPKKFSCVENYNPQKQKFESNFLKDFGKEIIEISETEEPKKKAIQYINLQLEEDNKFSYSNKFKDFIVIDNESSLESEEDKTSKEFFTKFVKNKTLDQDENIKISSPISVESYITHETVAKSDGPDTKDFTALEKLKRDFGMCSSDDLSSSIIIYQVNENNNKNNKSDSNNFPSQKASSFINKQNSDFLFKNHNYNLGLPGNNSEKSKDDNLFNKDFLQFSKKEDARNIVEPGKEENNFLSNSVQNFNSDSDIVENINLISMPIKIDNFPWLLEKTKSLRGILKLHYEILDFYEFIKPTSEEDRLRDTTVRKLKNLIKREYPCWKVKKFGSFPNKIHLPDSDVDIVIITTESDSTHNQLKILKKIGKILMDENCVDYIKLIEAKVPIIRATLKETKINIDISANRKNGYEAKKVIKKTLEDFPCMRPLIYVLKYFLRQRKLNESFTGGISSFLLFNLLLSYIQYVVKNENKLENNFSKTGEKNSNLTLGHLLVGFLQFFAFDFNFEEVGISVKYGGYFYKKSERGWLDTKRSWLLSVENFQDTEQDIGKSSFKFKKVLDCLKQARDALYYPSTYPIESYIGQFINVDKFIIERARKLKLYNDKLN